MRATSVHGNNGTATYPIDHEILKEDRLYSVVSSFFYKFVSWERRRRVMHLWPKDHGKRGHAWFAAVKCDRPDVSALECFDRAEK
jgi:hypothetical protein